MPVKINIAIDLQKHPLKIAMPSNVKHHSPLTVELPVGNIKRRREWWENEKEGYGGLKMSRTDRRTYHSGSMRWVWIIWNLNASANVKWLDPNRKEKKRLAPDMWLVWYPKPTLSNHILIASSNSQVLHKCRSTSPPPGISSLSSRKLNTKSCCYIQLNFWAPKSRLLVEVLLTIAYLRGGCRYYTPLDPFLSQSCSPVWRSR